MAERTVITRKAAKQAGLNRYFTGKPCSYGHTDERRTSDGKCIACTKSARIKNRIKAWCERNPERHRAMRKRAKQKAREKSRPVRRRRWHERRAELIARFGSSEGIYIFSGEPCSRGHIALRNALNYQCAECMFAYHRERTGSRSAASGRVLLPERLIDQVPRGEPFRLADVPGFAEWRHKRRHAIRAACEMRRRAAKLRASPKWADQAAMSEFYLDAAYKTADTGIPHEVDHIVPLLGATVRGLHVPWNLRVITKEENRRKRHKLVL